MTSRSSTARTRRSVTEGIDSLSLNPGSLLKMMVAIVDLEDTLAAANAAITRTELAIHEG